MTPTTKPVVRMKRLVSRVGQWLHVRAVNRRADDLLGFMGPVNALRIAADYARCADTEKAKRLWRHVGREIQARALSRRRGGRG